MPQSLDAAGMLAMSTDCKLRNVAPLNNQLSSFSGAWSKRMVCGILQVPLYRKPCQHETYRDLAITLMKTFVKAGLHQKYPEQWECLRLSFNEACTIQAQLLSKQRKNLQQIWREMEEYARGIIDPVAVENLVELKRTYGNHVQQLKAMVESGAYGRFMFLDAYNEGCVDAYGIRLDTALKELDSIPLELILPAHREALLAKASVIETELGVQSLLSIPHPLTSRLRNMQCLNTATSGAHEAELRWDAYYKSRGIEAGIIGMDWEDGIDPIDVVKNVDMHCHPALVKGINQARSNVNQLVERLKVTTSSNLAKTLRANREIWAPHDPNFILEIAYAEASGTKEGEAKYIDRVLDKFPKGDEICLEPNSLKTAFCELRKMVQSPAYRYLRKVCQDQVVSLVSIVETMSKGQAVDGSKLANNELIRSAKPLLLNFVNVTNSWGIIGQAVGGEALQKMLCWCENMVLDSPPRATI
jgi:hypothetical protein